MPPPNADFKSQVLAATDIVELIGQTVPLRKSSGSRFTGLCPFHNEKSPSFSVDQSKQFFYCFGCKEHGNAIDFVMKRDRVEFVDALKLLGQRAGLEMPKFGMTKEKTSERQALLDAHSAAASYFQQNLTGTPAGKVAREYLEKRGFSADAIRDFQVGVAIDAWDGLLRSPLVKKFPPPLLHLGGLAKSREKGGGFYDTFRNRLMFPIRDENGRVIAFGGRVMPGSQDPAKYLNSPETPLFNKSRCVFGLDLAKKRIVESRTVVIVEGYTDVIMAHQFGVSNVVSVLGTALTEQHVGLLKRFADRIVFLFDPDAAGDLAAERAVEVAMTGAFKDVRIATLPDGVDPDEYLLKFGKEAFEKILDSAPDAFAFRWTQLSLKHSTNGVVDQDTAVKEFLRPFDKARLSGTVDQLRWGFILTRVGRLLDMTSEQLNRIFDIRKTAAKAGPDAAAIAAAPPPSFDRPPYPYGRGGDRPYNREGRPFNRGDKAFGHDDRRFNRTRPPFSRDGGGNPYQRFGDAPPPPPTHRTPKTPMSPQVSAERWLLGCLLVEPQHWTNVQQHMQVEDFTDPQLRTLADIYWTHQRDEGEPAFNEFIGTIQDPAIAELAISLVENAQSFPDPKVAIKGALDRLTMEKERRQQQKLVADLRRTGVVEPMPEQAEVELLKRLQQAKKSQPGAAGG